MIAVALAKSGLDSSMAEETATSEIAGETPVPSCGKRRTPKAASAARAGALSPRSR